MLPLCVRPWQRVGFQCIRCAQSSSVSLPTQGTRARAYACTLKSLPLKDPQAGNSCSPSFDEQYVGFTGYHQFYQLPDVLCCAVQASGTAGAFPRMPAASLLFGASRSEMTPWICATGMAPARMKFLQPFPTCRETASSHHG